MRMEPPGAGLGQGCQAGGRVEGEEGAKKHPPLQDSGLCDGALMGEGRQLCLRCFLRNFSSEQLRPRGDGGVRHNQDRVVGAGLRHLLRAAPSL